MADPDDLALALSQPQQGEWDPEAADRAARFLGGVGKGLWQGYVQAPWQMVRHPIDTARGIATGVSNLAHHPLQSIDDTYHDYKNQVLSGPEGAGEVASQFLPGPGEIAKVLKGAQAVERPAIWAGSKAATYDPALAQQAAAMPQRLGATPREVYEATRSSALGGGGYWNPPKEWGQQQPWAWIDDSQARLKPDAMDKIAAAREPGASNALELGDILHHDALYDAYPALEHAPVDIAAPHATSRGGYSPSEGRFELNAGQPADQLLDAVLHETSHAVQQAEGMPGGTTSRNMVGLRLGLADLQDVPTAPIDAQAYARQLAAQLRGYDKDMVYPGSGSYYNSAGEVNARVPGEMWAKQVAAEPGAPPIYPFEQTGGAKIPKQEMPVIGAGGKLYYPGADASLEDFGLTSQWPSGGAAVAP